MKQTIKLKESQLRQLVTETFKKVLKEQKINEYTSINNVKGTFLPDKEHKEKRDWFINLIKTSKPLYIERFFDNEFLVLKIGEGKYARIQKTYDQNEDFWTTFHTEIFRVEIFNNIKVEPEGDKQTFHPTNRNFTSSFRTDGFGKLPHKADEIIDVVGDVSAWMVFNKKLTEMEKLEKIK